MSTTPATTLVTNLTSATSSKLDPLYADVTGPDEAIGNQTTTESNYLQTIEKDFENITTEFFVL